MPLLLSFQAVFRSVCTPAADVHAWACLRPATPEILPPLLRCPCFGHVHSQEHVVSFDPSHSPASASAVPVPELNISGISYTWAGAHAASAFQLPATVAVPAGLPAPLLPGMAQPCAPVYEHGDQLPRLAGPDGRHAGTPLRYVPLAFRPAGALEASPDLQHPWFDTCFVPVVLWAPGAHSNEASLTHLAAQLWALQAAGAMSNASLLVLGTPPGQC